MAEIGISIRRLYLDRGFYQVPVIRLLKDKGIPTIIPVVIRGKEGGTRRLLKGKKSYKTTYTLRSPKYGQVSFEIWVVVRYSQGKHDHQGIERFCYAVLGGPGLSISQVYQGYRRRFGIESSLLMNAIRARTTSPNPALRLLFVGIAFILLNIWVYLKWILGEPRRGGRFVHKDLFVLSRLCLFLTEAVKEIYSSSQKIPQSYNYETRIISTSQNLAQSHNM